jgi:MYXO-CTERM domain-containing protein
VEHNAGARFLVLDSDNTPECDPEQTGQCAADRECRDGNMGSSCCVPKDPTFMGTFLLVAGEPNKLCLNHWCPEYKAELTAGNDLGFVITDCEGINSIHFRVDANAIACEEDTTLFPCSFGCEAGKCLPDPCEAKLASGECEDYCKDGICLEDNPCTPLNCEHGCKNGRCLQSKAEAVGPDEDGDGFRYTGDCDDGNRYINPDQPELCGNGKDDDCDGERDEADCQSGQVTDGPVVVNDAGQVVDANLSDAGSNNNNGTHVSSGCNCRLNASPPGLVVLVLLLLVLLGTRRRS